MDAGPRHVARTIRGAARDAAPSPPPDLSRRPVGSRPRVVARSDVVELQHRAGNRAVATLVTELFAQRAKNAPGWDKADTRGEGWNAKTHEVGTIRRVPVDGLKLGNQEKIKGDERNKTTESAEGRAIVLIPPGVKPAEKVDVLLHFHGFTQRGIDPYAGWRQHSHSGTVRDVDQDRIEQQLQAATTRQLIAVLPQGAGASEFGPRSPFPVDAYLDEVFTRLDQIGEPPSKTPGPPMSRGQVILSGHSGGGDDVAQLLGTAIGRSAAEVILFEGIHKGGLTTVGDWAIGHLERVLRVLSSNPSDAKKDVRDAAVASCPKLMAYFSKENPRVPGSGGYAGIYGRLKTRLDTWFGDHAAVLGTHFDELRGRFRVEGIDGASHETIVRGLGDDPTAGPLYDGLTALRKPTAPSTLATKGSHTWVHPKDQPKVKPASSGAAGKATPSPAPGAAALTPTRILDLATAHGLSASELLATLPRLLRGGDPMRVLAEVLVIGGLRDDVDVTDILFAEAHPELGGSKIPPDRKDLAAEWVDLRRRYVKPALETGRAAPAPAPADAVAEPVSGTGNVDPTTVRPAKAATGAKPMTDEEKAAALKVAVEQGRTKGTKKARTQLEEALAFNGLDLETWYGDIAFDATFLDVPITPSGGSISGVHKELAAKLKQAEDSLVKTFAGLSTAQIAGKMGIYQVSGVRIPKAATGKSNISYHSFGLAIDINHPTNPFVGNQRPELKKNATAEDKAKYERYMESRSPRIIERAMLLLHHEAFDIEQSIKVPKGPGTRAGRLWEVHHRASESLAEYLRLADDLDGAKLPGLVSALPATAEHRDLEYWKRRIADDRVLIKNWDFQHHSSPEKGGYMDLGKELVEALVGAGLLWGGEYSGGKDIMHFDWRHGSLQRPPS